MTGHHAFRGMQALALGSLVNASFVVTAHAQTPIKLILNWKYEGPQGMCFSSPVTAAISSRKVSMSPSIRAMVPGRRCP